MIRTVAFILFATAVLASCVIIGGAQDFKNFGKCPVEYGFQGSFNFPKEIKSRVDVDSLKQMAPTVRNVILESLKAHVGEPFLRRLSLDYGNAVDFDDPADLKPNNDKRIDVYDLVFKYSDKVNGLSAFRFKVVADSTGKLIEKLALPNIAANPEKAKIISCREAEKIAEKNGFPLNRSRIYIVYDWNLDSLTWIVYDKKEVLPDQPSFTIGQTHRNISIDAHTGKVMKIYKETIAV